MHPSFAPYELGLIMLGVYALGFMLAIFVAGVFKNGLEKQLDPTQVAGDYDNRTYRMVRVYMNNVEVAIPIFGAGFVAVLLGASPWWINALITLIVILRFAHAGLYYFKVGKQAGGVRTVVHILSLVLAILLAVVAIL